MFSRLINPVVHSSAFALKANRNMSGPTLILQAWTLVHRVMGKIIEYEKLPLDSDVREVLACGYESMFNMDAPPDLSDLEADDEG